MPILQSNQKTAARGGKSSKTIRGNERVGEERLPPQKDRARQHVSSEQKSNAKQKTNTGKPENQTTKHKPNKPQNQSQNSSKQELSATSTNPHSTYIYPLCPCQHKLITKLHNQHTCQDISSWSTCHQKLLNLIICYTL